MRNPKVCDLTYETYVFCGAPNSMHAGLFHKFAVSAVIRLHRVYLDDVSTYFVGLFAASRTFSKVSLRPFFPGKIKIT